jgi:hypothetical protein
MRQALTKLLKSLGLRGDRYSASSQIVDAFLTFTPGHVRSQLALATLVCGYNCLPMA